VEYAEMMPVIQAEEALMEANLIALGMGALKKSDAQRLIGQLQRMASRRRAEPKTPERLQALLASAGIKFEVEDG